MAGPPYTVPPAWNDQSTAPLDASSAYIVPLESIEPTNITPPTTVTGPLTLAPPTGAVIDGLAICQRTSPLVGSSAPHEPTPTICPACEPLPASAYIEPS